MAVQGTAVLALLHWLRFTATVVASWTGGPEIYFRDRVCHMTERKYDISAFLLGPGETPYAGKDCQSFFVLENMTDYK